MKKLIIASALVLASVAVASAGATIDHNVNSKSQGSSIGQQSSAATGNGDVVSGNGTGAGFFAGDQTTYPGSRADLVHESNGTGGDNAGNNGRASGK